MTRTIQVRIPGNIVYVSGTVNDVPKTWTLSGDAWQCIADRSSDDVYHVDLTAVNVAGVSTNLQTTLYYGLHLLTAAGSRDGSYRAAVCSVVHNLSPLVFHDSNSVTVCCRQCESAFYFWVAYP